MQRAIFETFPRVIRKGDRTKIRMIEAAIKFVSNNGISQTHFESLAQAIKVARPHLVYHFTDLESLLEQCLRYISNINQEILVRRLAAASTPRKQFEVLIEFPFDWVKERPDQVRFRASMLDFMMVHPRFKSLHTDVVQMSLRRYSEVLAQLKPKASKSDLMELASKIYALQQGVLTLVLSSETETFTVWRARVKAVIHDWLALAR